MLDPGSGGGGQISHLISAEGKSPKGLLCHLHSVDILCERLCGCLLGIEMLSGAKLNFLTYHSLLFSPLSLPPSLPLFSSPLSLLPSTPCKECEITFGVFLFNQSFLFVCLSVRRLSVFPLFLSPSMFRPVLFCTSELILHFEPTHRSLCI